MKSFEVNLNVADQDNGEIQVNVDWAESFFTIPIQNRIYMLRQFIEFMSESVWSVHVDDIPKSLSGKAGVVTLNMQLEDESNADAKPTISYTGTLDEGAPNEKALALYACIKYLTKLGIAWVKKCKTATA